MVKSLRSIHAKDAKLTMSHMFIAFSALLIGASGGLLQTIVRSGKVTLPVVIDYYQILTLHGVILGLVLTTFFILGFINAVQSKTVGAYRDGERKIAWTGFLMMT